MRAIAKLQCPRHVDQTPSLVVSDTGWAHCFSCGWNIPAERLGFTVTKKEEVPKYVENLEASIRRIEALPRRLVRGLFLHCDRDSYYIVFPNRNYYRRRFLNPLPGGGKYRSPAGVSRPAFVLSGRGTGRTCVFVEGEINALSLKAVAPDLTVCCPGGAGDFHLARDLYRGVTRECNRLVAIVDKDPAGARAGLELVAALWPRKVEIQLWEPDANDLLQAGTLREQLENRLGVSGEAAVQELGEDCVRALGGGVALSEPRKAARNR